MTKSTLKSIGDHFGGKDHTTVMHSCKNVQNLIDTDQSFRDNVAELNQKILISTY